MQDSIISRENTKISNKDLILFKEEILKDMRNIKKSLEERYGAMNENISSKLNKFELKLTTLETKLLNITHKINSDNKMMQSIESLNKFKDQMNDNIFKSRAKFNEFESYMKSELTRINELLKESIIYPSLIGNLSRFKNFHDFMDYILEEISQFKRVKEKMEADNVPTKKRIEQIIDSFKLQMNNFNISSKNLITNSINESNDRISTISRIYDEKFRKLNEENSKFNDLVMNKLDEISIQTKFVKDDEFSNFGQKLKNFEDDLEDLNKKINRIQELINNILSNQNMSKINHNKEKKVAIYSGVKQYIQGNLDANELATMKKFTESSPKKNLNKYNNKKEDKKLFSSERDSRINNSRKSKDIIDVTDVQEQKYNSNGINNNFLLINTKINANKEKNEQKKKILNLLNSPISAFTNLNLTERKKLNSQNFNNKQNGLSTDFQDNKFKSVNKVFDDKIKPKLIKEEVNAIEKKEPEGSKIKNEKKENEEKKNEEKKVIPLFEILNFRDSNGNRCKTSKKRKKNININKSEQPSWNSIYNSTIQNKIKHISSLTEKMPNDLAKSIYYTHNIINQNSNYFNQRKNKSLIKLKDNYKGKISKNDTFDMKNGRVNEAKQIENICNNLYSYIPTYDTYTHKSGLSSSYFNLNVI